jgi:hypothetical protein
VQRHDGLVAVDQVADQRRIERAVVQPFTGTEARGTFAGCCGQ